MEKEKVLIIHNYYRLAGGEDTVVANEKKLLQEHGHEVEYYSRHNSELAGFSGLQKLVFPFATIFNYRTYREVKELIKEKRVDVVHVHNTLSLISPAVYYAAKKSRVPVVQTIHNFRLLCPGATFYRNGHICEECLEHSLWCAVKHKCYHGNRLQTLACVLNTRLHRLAGIYRKINYICLTEFTRDKLLKLKKIHPSRVFVKPNFTYDYGRTMGGGDYYIFVGRIEEIKGVDLLVEAFKRMPDRKLKMVGEGEEDRIFARLEAEDIRNIEMFGLQPHEKVREYIKNAKGLIMCSQCYETFGMVILEAFSSGTPAIVGDIGNIRELVEPGKTGERFIYNSVKSLVEAIDRFESGNMEDYRKNAYECYRNRFTPEMNYKMLMEIYRDLKD